jgi:hypothetical protein
MNVNLIKINSGKDIFFSTIVDQKGTLIRYLFLGK